MKNMARALAQAQCVVLARCMWPRAFNILIEIKAPFTTGRAIPPTLELLVNSDTAQLLERLGGTTTDDASDPWPGALTRHGAAAAFKHAQAAPKTDPLELALRALEAPNTPSRRRPHD